MVPLPSRIEGEHLLLRHWKAADVEALDEVIRRNLDHLRPWMPWVAEEPLTLADRRALIDTWAAQWSAGGDSVYGVFVGEVIAGGCGLHRRIGPHALELGYWTSVDHLGKGVASRAARLLTTAALQVPGISSVEIHHDKANLRSAAVPRRLGYRYIKDFSRDAFAPAETGVHSVWRMTVKLWERRRRAAPNPISVELS